MHIIVCIDDRNGLSFNGRRQSRDRVLTDYLLRLTRGSRLWISPGSLRLFEDAQGANINIDDNFLQEAEENDFCFVEDRALLPYEKWIRSLIVCRWNRVYPADRQLDLLPWEQGWKLRERTEFPGSSHEKLSVEVYEK